MRCCKGPIRARGLLLCESLSCARRRSRFQASASIAPRSCVCRGAVPGLSATSAISKKGNVVSPVPPEPSKQPVDVLATSRQPQPSPVALSGGSAAASTLTSTPVNSLPKPCTCHGSSCQYGILSTM